MFFASCLTPLKVVALSVKRATYSLKFKQAVIVFVEDNGNHRVTTEFGTDPACFIKWRNQRDQVIKGAMLFQKFMGPCKG